jgi:DNA-directed RNA polymerase specialized sigma24 family protein
LRAAVVLRFIERLPCEDVAAILREDVACVQARLHEACRTLCRRLDGHLKE